MGKIFYLMGKSSVGKDTIYKQILSDSAMDLRTIVLYTNRPIRAGEIQGVTYHFVSEEELAMLTQKQNVIEMRTYDTYRGRWKYVMIEDGRIDLRNFYYLMIGTLEGFVKTKAFFGEDMVLPVMIALDDGLRLQRALLRERKQDPPQYEEMCRRFLADAVDFSQENKDRAGICKEFYNEDLQTCIEDIKDYIWQCRQAENVLLCNRSLDAFQ